MADLLAREVDFFSIGTNDLIQYSLAIDRVNEQVAHMYQPLHPAILRLIHQTIEAGHRAGIPVAMCGEMAGDPLYMLILLGLGLDGLSMNPVTIPRVKQVIRLISYAESRRLVLEALESDHHRPGQPICAATDVPAISGAVRAKRQNALLKGKRLQKYG